MVLIALPCYSHECREEGHPLGLDTWGQNETATHRCLPSSTGGAGEGNDYQGDRVAVEQSRNAPSSTGGAGFGNENGGYRRTKFPRGEIPGNHERLGANATRERTPPPQTGRPEVVRATHECPGVPPNNH